MIIYLILKHSIKLNDINLEEMIMNRMSKRLVLIVLFCLTLWLAIPALAEETLKVFGNANMDPNLDESDITALKDIIGGKMASTEYADANHDGIIDDKDIAQVQDLLSNQAKSITINDSAGRILTVKLPVERFVSTDYRTTEALLALGTQDMIVAVDKTFHERMPEFDLADRPEVAVHAGEINYEQILLLDPDLVLLPTSKATTAADIQEKFQNITVLVIGCTNRDTMNQEFKMMGLILGKTKEVDDLLSWMHQYDEVVDSRTKDLAENDMPTFYYESNSDQKQWTAYTPQVAGRVAEGCGGRNIAADLPGASITIEPEWQLKENPDFIILDLMKGNGSGMGKTAADMQVLQAKLINDRNVSGFSSINAVKNGNVCLIDRDLTSGPRWVIGHAYIARWLHPDLFKDLSPAEMNREYLKKFFNLEIEGTWAYPEPT